MTKLARVIAALRAKYGRPTPPASDAFELVLWEKVAYLAPDARRAKAFEALRVRVGLTPLAIAEADPAVLHAVAAVGGAVAVAERVKNMQDAAVLAIDDFDGSLDNALALPIKDAMRALQRIRGIGEPGAEKILLLTRTYRLLAVDSNGLRTLQRLGYGINHKNYSTMYRSVRDAVGPELPKDFDALIDGHLLLRRHGQEVCKAMPRCSGCALRALCATGQLTA